MKDQALISFCTMACPGLGAAKAADLALKWKFNGLDLRASDYLGELPAQPSPGQITEVRRELEDRGLIISGLLCYNPALDLSDPSPFKEALKFYRDVSAELGTRSFRIFGGDPGQEEENYLQKFAEILNEVLDSWPENLQMRLQHHQGSLSWKQALKLNKLVKNPNFAPVFSPDHCFLMSENLNTALEEALNTVSQIYISDLGPGAFPEERQWDAVLPGTGQVPLEAILRRFHNASFTGTYTFKWEKIWQNRIPEANEALEHFQTWFKSIGL